MTTTDEVERVTHLALEKAGGNKSIAAGLLGLTYQQLKNRINNNKNLKIRWGTSKKDPQPPGEAVTIHREAPPTDSEDVGLVLQTEEEIAAALKKEDDSIKRGLEGMGLPEKLQKLGLSLREFQGKHFKSSLQMIGGGITMQFLNVMAAIQEIDERLAGKFSEFPLTLPEEIVLREDRSRLLIVMNQFSDRVNKSALIQAKIYQMMKSQDKPGQNSGKPKGYLNLESANPE